MPRHSSIDLINCAECGRTMQFKWAYLIRIPVPKGYRYERICGTCYTDFIADGGEDCLEDTPCLEDLGYRME